MAFSAAMASSIFFAPAKASARLPCCTKSSAVDFTLFFRSAMAAALSWMTFWFRISCSFIMVKACSQRFFSSCHAASLFVASSSLAMSCCVWSLSSCRSLLSSETSSSPRRPSEPNPVAFSLDASCCRTASCSSATCAIRLALSLPHAAASCSNAALASSICEMASPLAPPLFNASLTTLSSLSDDTS